MNDTSIGVTNLNVWYSMNHILKNLSFDIPKNRITVISGPSGCGKTTLLKTLNRLIELRRDVRITGKIVIDGEDILQPRIDLPALRKKIGFLAQKPHVLPMTIFKNVAYGPKIHGLNNKKVLKNIVEQQLRISNLWEEVKDRLHSSASELSIGQQQRLCFARSLAVQPDILLADEPTSALDPESVTHIEHQLIQLKCTHTIVLVTHALGQAKRIADHVLIMHSGTLVKAGPAAAILQNQYND